VLLCWVLSSIPLQPTASLCIPTVTSTRNSSCFSAQSSLGGTLNITFGTSSFKAPFSRRCRVSCKYIYLLLLKFAPSFSYAIRSCSVPGRFLYDPEKFGNRASITLTLLLVIVAKSFQLTTFLPRLRFLTLCDQFVRGAFNFLCLMILQNFIASLLAIRNAAAATPFDRITMWLMGIAWMLFLAYMAVSSYFLRQKELSKEPKPVYVPPKRN
jgi:hypothetical protein